MRVNVKNGLETHSKIQQKSYYLKIYIPSFNFVQFVVFSQILEIKYIFIIVFCFNFFHIIHLGYIFLLPLTSQIFPALPSQFYSLSLLKNIKQETKRIKNTKQKAQLPFCVVQLLQRIQPPSSVFDVPNTMPLFLDFREGYFNSKGCNSWQHD